MTNDPAPTATGHWEIYSFASGEGRKSILDADTGVELNYGPLKDVQLSVAFPISLSHEPLDGWRTGTGHAELGVKYRVFEDKSSGISAAIFPKAILPTASRSLEDKTKFQFPLWFGKDFAGGTSLFGGSAYEINPGHDNKNFWLVAVAMTHAINPKFSVGAEVTEQSGDTIAGTAQTRAGVGSTIRLSDHYGVLLSAGPTWADHRTRYHFYGALGLFF